MRTGHSVVPIGGAPFVPPYSKIRSIDTSVPSASYAFSSSASSSGSAAAMYYPPPTSSTLSPSIDASYLSEAHPRNSGCLSPFSASSGSSTGSGRDSGSSPQLEAALRYSYALHEHTRKMWENERHSIEKLRFDSSSTSSSSTAAGSGGGGSDHSSASPPQDGPNRRSSLSASLGVDAFWNRTRGRHTKNSASIH
ncbi:hypothetical protein CBS101457_001420 [Exobasidium rhododendri]|nr:hypothetical protein CBS101457_001420 [Exobasidium rhododendri]